MDEADKKAIELLPCDWNIAGGESPDCASDAALRQSRGEEMSDDAANKKARELMEYCSGAAWEDGVMAIADALREKDAKIQKLKFDADLREDEITRLIKQYDVTDTKLEAVRLQLERAKVERDALKGTYDKTVERLSRELEAARGKLSVAEESFEAAVKDYNEARQAVEQAAERQRDPKLVTAAQQVKKLHDASHSKPCQIAACVLANAILAQAEVKP